MITKDDIKHCTNLVYSSEEQDNTIAYIETSKVADELQKLINEDYDNLIWNSARTCRDLRQIIQMLRAKEEKNEKT